jgi:hypothetical protein
MTALMINNSTGLAVVGVVKNAEIPVSGSLDITMRRWQQLY